MLTQGSCGGHAGDPADEAGLPLDVGQRVGRCPPAAGPRSGLRPPASQRRTSRPPSWWKLDDHGHARAAAGAAPPPAPARARRAAPRSRRRHGGDDGDDDAASRAAPQQDPAFAGVGAAATAATGSACGAGAAELVGGLVVMPLLLRGLQRRRRRRRSRRRRPARCACGQSADLVLEHPAGGLLGAAVVSAASASTVPARPVLLLFGVRGGAAAERAVVRLLLLQPGHGGVHAATAVPRSRPRSSARTANAVASMSGLLGLVARRSPGRGASVSLVKSSRNQPPLHCWASRNVVAAPASVAAGRVERLDGVGLADDVRVVGGALRLRVERVLDPARDGPVGRPRCPRAGRPGPCRRTTCGSAPTASASTAALAVLPAEVTVP